MQKKLTYLGFQGAADRLAARTKRHVQQYLDSGHDVTSAAEFAAGASEMEGVLVRHGRIEVSAESVNMAKKLKWPGISKLYNFKFEGNQIKAWQAYDIGTGKNFNLEQLNPKLLSFCSKFVSDTDPADNIGVPWQRVRPSRAAKSTTSSTDDFSASEVLPVQCTDDGCTVQFETSEKLEEHLLSGLHRYEEGRETMTDTAMKHYAAAQQSLLVRVSEDLFAGSEEETVYSEDITDEPELQPGWALKMVSVSVPFTDDQKKYLTEIWQKGEQTRLKAISEVVAKEMRHERLTDGQNRFQLKEWLSSQQIARFWSGLSQKKSLQLKVPRIAAGTEEEGEDDSELPEEETDRIAAIIEETIKKAQNDALLETDLATERVGDDTLESAEEDGSESSTVQKGKKEMLKKGKSSPTGVTPEAKKGRRRTESSTSDEADSAAHGIEIVLVRS